MIEKKYFKEYEEKINIDLEVCFNNLKKDSAKIDLKYLTEASAVYSSNIEGNLMDLNSFMNAKTIKQKTKPREYSEITELTDAYDFAQKNKLTEDNLLDFRIVVVFWPQVLEYLGFGLLGLSLVWLLVKKKEF